MENNQNLNIVGVLEWGPEYPYVWGCDQTFKWAQEERPNRYRNAIVSVFLGLADVAAHRKDVYLPVVDCPEPVTLDLSGVSQ